MKRHVMFLCLIVGMFARSGAAQSQVVDEPQANPGRPTVSTPATLTPVGYLQFETGFVAAGHSPEFSSFCGINEVVKLSVMPRLELMASAQPVTHSTSEGSDANLVADEFLGVQGVLYGGKGAKPTLAVSYMRRIYDGGAPDFDSGSPVNSGVVLASADVKGFHYDANAFFSELAQGPMRRGQFGQSLAISRFILHRFVLSGELWHFTQPFLESDAVGNLWSVSYEANKTLVFDVGFDRGLTGTSTEWELTTGLTYLLPHRLWRKRAVGGNGGPHERRASFSFPF
jgi:hypothetical protein